MISISLFEFLVLCDSILLVLFLLSEVLDWAEVFSCINGERALTSYSFGYADGNGPHAWKILFPESNGTNQSPINITSRTAVVVQPSEPLKWSGYASRRPSSMSIANLGNTVVLTATWNNSLRPSIGGGPLNGTYDFYSMVFHWGHTNGEGSEHTLDYFRYPMELQVIHIRECVNSAPEAGDSNDVVVIVSFFFQITEADNPYLDHVVTNLWRITRPGSKAHIPPFPLEWLFPNFEKRYYTYNGSLTQPPCSEIVTWIVYPEPIAVSASQVQHFRNICSENGPILCNCRPVQLLNDRDVYYYE